MWILQMLPQAAEEGAGITPYLVGGGALVLLVLAVFAMLAFGKGREHS